MKTPAASVAYSLADAQMFVTTVDHGSFSAAAADHGVTPSGVSKAVTRLERDLGLRLLVRSTRTLRLTDEGELFHARFSEALTMMRAAGELARESSTSLSGTLRLGLPVEVGSTLIVPRLAPFLDAHPQLDIELLDVPDARTLYNRRVDCAILVGDIDDPMLAGRPLGSADIVTVASSRYLQAYGVPTDPDDLRHHHLITRTDRDGNELPWRLQNGPDGAVVSLAVHGRLRCTWMRQIVAAVLAGLGVARVPEFLVADDLRAGRLQRLLPQFHTGGVTAWIVYPAQRVQPRRVREFVDFLVNGSGGFEPSIHAPGPGSTELPAKKKEPVA